MGDPALAKPANGRNPYYRGPPSDHFDGRSFFNPGGRAPAGFRDLLRWQLSGNRTKWPSRWDSPFQAARPDERVDGGGLRVTMVGHSTLLVQIAGLNILTDPVWSKRASPFAFAGPRRVNAPGIALDDLPPVDVVLVSHNHYDHLDLATLKRLHGHSAPLIITALGNDSIIASAVPRGAVRAVDWNEMVELRFGNRVHAVPVHHWSARAARDRRMALWCGFVIETAAGSVFFAGDTGFHDGAPYRNLLARYGAPRLAILPIGAYAPRWFMESQHQNPDEAVQGMIACGAAFAAGCHWGTFHLTDEPIEEPATLLAAALSEHDVAPQRFRALQPGEVWDVPTPEP